MSEELINRSPDLRELRNKGYDIEIRSSGFLLVKDVPYVNSRQEIKRGTLVSNLALTGDITVAPDTHVVHFIGDHPCHANGSEMGQIKNASNEQTLAEGIVIQHTFSAKPTTPYPDYYAKMTAYVAILSGPAQVVDPKVTAQTFPVIQPGKDEETPFNYIDTASSRAGIAAVSSRLKLKKVALVGLGGTGSYVLDLVAKTPVWEIHLYDGDTFFQHNAFRAPGAPSVDELNSKFPKVSHFKNIYSKMHKGIIEHAVYVDEHNVDELRDMDFVFLCLDSGEPKKFIVENLEGYGVSFVDVGMGIDLENEALGGMVRVTTSTPEKRDHFRSRVSFGGGNNDDYSQNIQIADLNALNAALAVVKWKKLFGFYRDMKGEHHSLYTIDGNLLVSQEKTYEKPDSPET